MINMTIGDAARMLNLKTTGDTTTFFSGISIDTRELTSGNLFVALKGTRVDGHEFVTEAQAKGASSVLVSKQVSAAIPQLIAPDPLDALAKLTAKWRENFNLPLIGITGSNGKTTLKNMLAAILNAFSGNESFVLATKGNLNNHVGVPLTLARLNSLHRFAVVEMGMNHFNEIALLSRLAKPDVAIITNAAAAHIAGVGGTVAGVAKAKAEIFEGLSQMGTAILNRDDTYFNFWKEKIAGKRLLSFGFHPEALVRATILKKSFVTHIMLHTPKGDIEIHLPLLGDHNVMNAMAASAAALSLDIKLSAIKTGLEQLKPAPGRLELHTLNNGVHIIDDTYNANPFSLQAAIRALNHFTGTKILVLGDMKELGETAKSAHLAAGTDIRNAGINYLFTYGELSENAAFGFGEGAYHFQNQEKLIQALKPFLFNQATILIKGSRSMHMENIVASLVHA